jgi:hypothetical protein
MMNLYYYFEAIYYEILVLVLNQLVLNVLNHHDFIQYYNHTFDSFIFMFRFCFKFIIVNSIL